MTKELSPAGATVRQRRWNTSALIGIGTVSVIGLLALVGPLLVSYGPQELSADRLLPPSADHWMGTDNLGRDIFSRVVGGARLSLMVGLASAAIATLFGGMVGLLAGYTGGMFDDAVMRITEVFQVIPRFLLAIVVVAILGPSVANVIFVIAALAWPIVARIIRAQVFVFRREEFVLAAVMGGASKARVLWRHLVPNILPFLIVAAALQAGQAILVESFLSFLGLADPLRPSLGLLLNQAQLYLSSAWWMSVFPGLVLSLLIIGLNLAGDGIGEVLNPRRKNA